MSKRNALRLLGAGLAALVGGCVAASVQTQPSTDAPTEQPAPTSAPEASTASAPVEDSTAAPSPEAFAGCAARIDEGPTRDRMIAGRKAKQTGAQLRFTEPDTDGKLVVGVLGPVNEATGINLLALRKYLTFFAEQQAEVIVVTGDVAETAEGITRVLTELSTAKLPVLVMSGNRECKADFAEGVAQAQSKFDGIVNLNAIRSVELGGVTFVSLPGYHEVSFISCETGCSYDQRTLDDVATLARNARTPVALVSHSPPKGSSKQAVDYASNGYGNTGDPRLNAVIKDAKIAFGFFSNIKEAGTRATPLDLVTQIPEGKPVKALLLNPGPADTSRWEMNNGQVSFGNAVAVTFENGSASWKAFRAQKPTPEEKKAAKALEH